MRFDKNKYEFLSFVLLYRMVKQLMFIHNKHLAEFTFNPFSSKKFLVPFVSMLNQLPFVAKLKCAKSTTYVARPLFMSRQMRIKEMDVKVAL